MGTLYLVATPIGNLDDITLRAVKILLSVPFIACEDTRKSGLLRKILGAKYSQNPLLKEIKIASDPEFISFYDEVEEEKINEIIFRLQKGEDVALVSDSGTPLISDPGFKLVKACYLNSLKVVPVPGPAAAITALSVSALPSNQFIFLGFLPPKESKRKKLLTDLKAGLKAFQSIKPSIIFYVSPHKFVKTLKSIQEIFGDAEIAVARELTKVHEEILRGKISIILPKLNEIKGEITVVLNPPKDF